MIRILLAWSISFGSTGLFAATLIESKEGARVAKPDDVDADGCFWSGRTDHNGFARGQGLVVWLKGNRVVQVDSGVWRDGRAEHLIYHVNAAGQIRSLVLGADGVYLPKLEEDRHTGQLLLDRVRSRYKPGPPRLRPVRRRKRPVPPEAKRVGASDPRWAKADGGARLWSEPAATGFACSWTGGVDANGLAHGNGVSIWMLKGKIVQAVAEQRWHGIAWKYSMNCQANGETYLAFSDGNGGWYENSIRQDDNTAEIKLGNEGDTPRLSPDRRRADLAKTVAKAAKVVNAWEYTGPMKWKYGEGPLAARLVPYDMDGDKAPAEWSGDFDAWGLPHGFGLLTWMADGQVNRVLACEMDHGRRFDRAFVSADSEGQLETSDRLLVLLDDLPESAMRRLEVEGRGWHEIADGNLRDEHIEGLLKANSPAEDDQSARSKPPVVLPIELYESDVKLYSPQVRSAASIVWTGNHNANGMAHGQGITTWRDTAGRLIKIDVITMSNGVQAGFGATFVPSGEVWITYSDRTSLRVEFAIVRAMVFGHESGRGGDRLDGSVFRPMNIQRHGYGVGEIKSAVDPASGYFAAAKEIAGEEVAAKDMPLPAHAAPRWIHELPAVDGQPRWAVNFPLDNRSKAWNLQIGAVENGKFQAQQRLALPRADGDPHTATSRNGRFYCLRQSDHDNKSSTWFRKNFDWQQKFREESRNATRLQCVAATEEFVRMDLDLGDLDWPVGPVAISNDGMSIAGFSYSPKPYVAVCDLKTGEVSKIGLPRTDSNAQIRFVAPQRLLVVSEEQFHVVDARHREVLATHQGNDHCVAYPDHHVVLVADSSRYTAYSLKDGKMLWTWNSDAEAPWMASPFLPVFSRSTYDQEREVYVLRTYDARTGNLISAAPDPLKSSSRFLSGWSFLPYSSKMLVQFFDNGTETEVMDWSTGKTVAHLGELLPELNAAARRSMLGLYSPETIITDADQPKVWRLRGETEVELFDVHGYLSEQQHALRVLLADLGSSQLLKGQPEYVWLRAMHCTATNKEEPWRRFEAVADKYDRSVVSFAVRGLRFLESKAGQFAFLREDNDGGVWYEEFAGNAQIYLQREYPDDDPLVWKGNRDDEGRAHGQGTLLCELSGKRTSITGMMEHGRFEGTTHVYQEDLREGKLDFRNGRQTSPRMYDERSLDNTLSLGEVIGLGGAMWIGGNLAALRLVNEILPESDSNLALFTLKVWPNLPPKILQKVTLKQGDRTWITSNPEWLGLLISLDELDIRQPIVATFTWDEGLLDTKKPREKTRAVMLPKRSDSYTITFQLSGDDVTAAVHAH